MFPIVTLAGTPYQRGQQYAQQAATQITHSIASYALLFAHDRGLAWAAAQHLAAAYVPILAERAPHLLEEMRGIADTLDVHLNEIVALNARTELLAGDFYSRSPNYAAAQAANIHQGVPQLPDLPQRTLRTECTTVVALPDATRIGNTLLAQTWDWVKIQRAACVVLRILPENPDHPTILTLTEAGIVGKIGLNSSGLGVSLNILSSLQDGEQPDLPIHILLRLAMEHHSVASALELLRTQRGAASSCITLADADGQAACVELTPQATQVIAPEDGLLVHTNHCLTDATRANMRPVALVSSTEPRYDRAIALLQQQHGELDVDTMMDLLRDEYDAPRCICRTTDASLHPADQVETVAAVVMDVAQRLMYIAADRPCATDFVPVLVRA
ncbi:MAG: peptidase C45 [Chloroflexaceae bacterium]|nr:peptidase C45 [Chloroflexaceae bacterium]